MTIRILAAPLVAAGLLVGTTAAAQTPAGPASLSLASTSASAIFLSPPLRPKLRLAPQPVRNRPQIPIHAISASRGPLDGMVARSAQFDHGAEGFRASVSTFGVAGTF